MRVSGISPSVRRSVEASVVAIAVMLSNPVAAQDAGAGDDQAEPGAIADDIVVTARRREESLQSVPVAVTALPAEKLEELSVQNVADLQGVVPNLQFGSQSSNGGRKGYGFALRGLRSSAVTIYSSEIVRSPRSVSDSFYDLGSVEVLKGPQGTLFGSNSTSGAIVFRPAEPKDVLEGSIEMRAGNYGMFGGTAAINLPIALGAAIRVAIDGEDRGGFVKRTDGGPALDSDKHYGGRVSLKLDPVDGIENLTVAEYTRAKGRSAHNFPFAYVPCGTPPAAGSIPCTFVAPATAARGLPTYVEAFNRQQQLGSRRTDITGAVPFSDVESLAISNVTDFALGAPMNGALGELSIRAILGYVRTESYIGNDVDGLPIVGLFSGAAGVSKSRSFEAQIRGDGDDKAFNWVLGVYMARDTSNNQNVSITRAPFNVNNPVNSTTVSSEKQLAGYGQVTLRLVEGLNATGGFRYTRTKSTNRQSTRLPTRCGLGAGFGVDLVACQRSLAGTFKEPSWTLGLDYQIDPQTLIYVASRRGFNAGGFNGVITAENSTFKPEKLTDIEFGVKRDWLMPGSRLRTNVALFKNFYNDVQRRTVSFVTVNGLQTAQSVTLNAAKAAVTGLELETDWAFDNGLGLSLSGSYMDATYKDFPFTLTNGTVIDLSDNRIAQAPKWTFQAGARYQHDLPGDAGTLHLSASYAYQSRIIFSDINNLNNVLPNFQDVNDFQGAYGLVSGRVAWNDVAGSAVSLAVWVKNLTDKRYYVSKVNAGALGISSGIFGEPRTFGFEASMRF